MDAEFYNKIYSTRPLRWDDKERDVFVGDSLSEPSSLLDIGCGTGHTIRHLSSVWPETEFYGVDLSSVAIQLANDRKIPNAKFYVGDVMDMDIEIPAVNTVLLMGVAEHFRNQQDIARIRKFIKPSGFLYLEIPNCLSCDDSKEEGFRKTSGGSGQDEWHLRRETWEDIIKVAGYKIAKSLIGHRSSWEFIWVLQ